MRRTGALEWPLRVLLVIGGILLATPGGGIMPLSNLEMEIYAAVLLVPAVLLALVFSRTRGTKVY